MRLCRAGRSGLRSASTASRYAAEASFHGLADGKTELHIEVVANVCSQSGRASTQSSRAPAATSLRDYSVQERTDVSTQEHFVDQGEQQPETVRGGVLSPYYV